MQCFDFFFVFILFNIDHMSHDNKKVQIKLQHQSTVAMMLLSVEDWALM